LGESAISFIFLIYSTAWTSSTAMIPASAAALATAMTATSMGLPATVGTTVQGIHTAKTKCRKFETNITRKGISGPQSQFPHSCVCERIIYSHDGSACFAGGNM
jgi:hypothetical protein